MTTLLRWWKAYGKAHVALVGGVLIWLSTTYPDTPLGHYAGLIVAALTFVGVIAAPHKSKAAPKVTASSPPLGTVTVNVEADLASFLDSLAGHLHTAGDALTKAKPKARTK